MNKSVNSRHPNPELLLRAPKHRREIDGLRAVAVVPVILFHSGLGGFSGGYVGVDVFFVISGFLITSLILYEKEAGTFSLVRFYERRVRRILPALSFVMLMCLPFAWLWMIPYQLRAFSQSIASVALLSSNILFWWEIGYFGDFNEAKPLLHTWSLSIEEQFYLLFPLCVILIWRFDKRWLFTALLTVACVSLALAEWGWRRHMGATFYLAPTRAWEILLGALAAVFHFGSTKIAFPLFVTPGRQALNASASLVGFSLIAYAAISFDSATPTPSTYTLIPTVGAALILLFATPQTLVGRILGHRWLVGIGLISYSAYLWHQPLFAFARIRNPDKLSIELIASLIGLSILLAYVTWQYVERPFRNKTSLSRQAVFVSAALAFSVMIGVGVIGQFDHGFVSRYPTDDRYLMSINPGVQGRYISNRAARLRLGKFDSRMTKKIFIVGDSFADDFVNSFAENNLLREASVSTFRIPANCGVIITKEDFTFHIDTRYRDACERNGRFESSDVQILLKEADIVILVAQWNVWEVPYVNETIEALKRMGAKKVIVIGRKSFGNIVPIAYIGMSNDEKRNLRNRVDLDQKKVNEYMRGHLATDVFVDTQAYICGDDSTCPVFTENLRLISLDGRHLTEDGARYVGTRIFRHPLLAPLMSPL